MEPSQMKSNPGLIQCLKFSEPYIDRTSCEPICSAFSPPGLLFKSGMENIGRCAGVGHSNPATVTIGTVTTGTEDTVTATTIMAKSLTASPVTHVPDFLCVGAQKAGTSWLYRQLEPHPDFWMPPVKEFHYLDQLNRTKRHSRSAPRG